MADKTFTERVIAVQSQLKAPKNQRNNFGGYNYRNCEDILEAVKPLLKAEGLYLTITDDIVVLGDRFYVKATATLTDGERSLSNQAFAREEATKKGMDGSQVTGAASSYARKYALNGLLAIDDTKDADSLLQILWSKPNTALWRRYSNAYSDFSISVSVSWFWLM